MTLYIKKTALLLVLALSALNVQAADYNILSYGAKSDTTVLSTQALQQAIDACHKAGGGRVVVPAGHYKTGTIILKSNVHLYLEQGATLYGSTNLMSTFIWNRGQPFMVVPICRTISPSSQTMYPYAPTPPPSS